MKTNLLLNRFSISLLRFSNLSLLPLLVPLVLIIFLVSKCKVVFCVKMSVFRGLFVCRVRVPCVSAGPQGRGFSPKSPSRTRSTDEWRALRAIGHAPQRRGRLILPFRDDGPAAEGKAAGFVTLETAHVRARASVRVRVRTESSASPGYLLNSFFL